MDHVKVLVYIFLEIFMGKEKINYLLLFFFFTTFYIYQKKSCIKTFLKKSTNKCPKNTTRLVYEKY